mgnify:FL=1
MTYAILKLVEKINDEQDLENNLNELKTIVIEDVYENESYKILSQVVDKIVSQDITRDLEDDILSETSLFMKTKHIRKANFNYICSLIETVFRYIYFNYESYNYVFSKEKVDKLYSTELQYVINYAEYLIIGKCISERWFKSIFSQKGKLPDKITDCIWGIFSNSRNQIKETVHFRYLASIDQKLNALMNEHDEIKDELEFVQYLILDRTKQ